MPLTSNGIHYEYWGIGDSPLEHPDYPSSYYSTHRLTLINGFARSMSDFRAFARVLRKANISVIMIDNRTTGATLAAAPFSLNTLADDVIEVWDHLGIDSASVLGISMGGAIALTLALRHRQRVERLILISSFTRRTHNDDDAGFAQVRARIINSVAPCFYAKNTALMCALAAKTAKQICTGVHRPQSQALQGYDVSDKLADIYCPTLIIHGQADRIVPRQQAEILAAGIANAKLVMFKAAGHLLLMEKHSELLAEVIEFVAD